MNGDTEVRYRRAEIDGNVLGDEIVFFDDQAGKYFAIGAVGADIWKLLDTPMSLTSIVERLSQHYEVSEATCRYETQQFLDRMLELNLLLKA